MTSASRQSVKVIRKDPKSWTVAPNFTDYEALQREFSWDAMRRELQGLPEGGGINIAHEAVDRHASGDLRDRAALRWFGAEGEVLEFTYADMKRESDRFANILQRLGAGKGSVVCTLADRIPDLYFTALGTWKNTSVFCPLFSHFGPEPIHQRMSKGDAAILLTTTSAYKRKVAGIMDRLPMLRWVLLTDAAEDLDAKTLSLPRLKEEAPEAFQIPPTDPEDVATLHFTSGSTGAPKGMIHVHDAVVAHYATGKYVLDLRPGDVFWCTADPGWVTGVSYGIIAPLLHGSINIVDQGEFDADRWCGLLESQKVNVWYTSPTAVRRLMRLGERPRLYFDFRTLRCVHSVGEPLHAEEVLWSVDALGLPIHDNWWQTETGAIMIANFPAMDIRVGSMGRPAPGVEAAIVRRVEGGGVEVIEEPDAPGEIALRAGWPSMARGCIHEEERYKKDFAGGWRLTGDAARRDADGYFWFIGRLDDVIKSAGRMVGPFEVEGALMEHPAVFEAGVIGKPDPLLGESVKAFIALKPGVEASEELRSEILGFVRKRLGPSMAPREIEFQTDLPKNRAGKIMRRLLKARELGLPEGDVSTLEPPVQGKRGAP